ncbi:MAG: hypothetical protein MJ133_10650 [Lachnospiraceae bacterium]|nr:hypothetical protein [Lachnospiraceae bacterium]
MKCNRCIKLIPDFWNDGLDINELEGFISHINKCDECREELTIDFLVKEGLQSLESGNTFDLNESLKHEMNSATHKLNVRKKMKSFYHFMSTIVFLMFAALVAYLVIYK